MKTTLASAFLCSLCLASPAPSQNSWFENIPGTLPVLGTRLRQGVMDYLMADLTGDGVGELWALPQASRDKGEYLFRLDNNGWGGFRSGVSGLPKISSPITLPKGVLFMDVDRDGDLDVVLGLPRPLPQVLINDGKGVLKPKPQFIPESKWRGPFFPIDLDGDGDLDLLSSYGKPWIQDGKGGFSFLSDKSVWGLNPRGEIQAVADLDGDGDEDLVAVTSITNPTLDVFVIRNDGNLKFTVTQKFRAKRGTREWWRLADFNRDGRPDLVNLFLGQVFLGTGKGGFIKSKTFSLNQSVFGYDIGDLDGDGWLDFLVSPWLNRPLQVWLFDPKKKVYQDRSKEFFPTYPLPKPAFWNFRPRLHDVDHDGDPDLLMANGLLLLNFHHQVWVAYKVRVGNSFEVFARGLPGEQAFLFGIPGKPGKGFSIPSLGLWRLGAAFFLGTQALSKKNVGAEASFRFQLPQDPSLVGKFLTFQAVLGSVSKGLRFTNAFGVQIFR